MPNGLSPTGSIRNKLVSPTRTQTLKMSLTPRDDPANNIPLTSTAVPPLTATMSALKDMPATYDDLPDKRRYWPAASGSAEEGLGMLRILTPDVVANAARTQILTGERVCLNWDIQKLNPPCTLNLYTSTTHKTQPSITLQNLTPHTEV